MAVIGPIVVGVVSLVAFIAWAKHVEAPAIDLSLFRERTYAFTNLATLAFGIAFAMMFFTMFQFLTGVWCVWGYSLSHAGIAAAPGPILVIPASVISGRIAARVGHRSLIVTGALVFAAGALWNSFALGAEPAYLAHWVPGMLLVGIGTGMVLPSLSAAAVSRLPPQRFGIGSAVNQATRQIGSVLGVELVVVLLGRQAALADFSTVFRWEIGFALATAAPSLAIDTRPR